MVRPPLRNDVEVDSSAPWLKRCLLSLPSPTAAWLDGLGCFRQEIRREGKQVIDKIVVRPCFQRRSHWCCFTQTLLCFREDFSQLHYAQHLLNFCICSLALEFHRKKQPLNVVWTKCTQKWSKFQCIFSVYRCGSLYYKNLHLFKDQLITQQSRIYVQ